MNQVSTSPCFYDIVIMVSIVLKGIQKHASKGETPECSSPSDQIQQQDPQTQKPEEHKRNSHNHIMEF